MQSDAAAALGRPRSNMPRRKYRIEIEQETVLWRDRKRYLGLPLSFTRYEVTPTRITIRTGFFTTHTEEILLFRVLDLQTRRTLGQKYSESAPS